MVGGQKEDNDFNRARMDFQIEVIETDDTTRTVTFRLVPDPRRYDEVEIDGVTYFLDKYLNHAISAKEMLGKCAEQAKGLPLYQLSSRIKSTPDYAAARRDALRSELRDGNYVPPAEKPALHGAFDARGAAKWIAFLSIDICRGTALRRADPAVFERAYKVFLRELGTVLVNSMGEF